MAFIYLIAGDRGSSKSYVAQKLGLEFAVNTVEDVPSAVKVSDHIHSGNNVIITTGVDHNNYAAIYEKVYGYATIAGTKLITIDMTVDVDGRE